MRLTARAGAAAVILLAGISACAENDTGAPPMSAASETPGSVQSETPGSVQSETPGSVQSETPIARPPFIASVRWTQTPLGASLRVFPTGSGRRAQEPADLVNAWSEVVADSAAAGRSADTPGMFAQFRCHWTFARLVESDKTSWNLEPWRPVVDDAQMIAGRCNPGGPEQ